ncbi:MAG: DUF4153 domain-containing protein [Clostridium sp.]|nr:DUF4153 domain-containing protein [Clostridium sp.]
MKITVSKNIQEFIRKIKSVFESNKITFILIILFTIWEAVHTAIPYKYYKELPDVYFMIGDTLSCLIIPSLFIETYFAENKVKSICGYIIAVLLSETAIVCVKMDEKIEQATGLSDRLISEYFVLFAGGICLILLIAVVYKSFQKSNLSFAEYGIKVFYNVAKAMFIWFVLSFGSLFIYMIIEELFVEHYSIFEALFFAEEILVMGIYLAPKMILALRDMDMDEEPDKVIHTIVKYILPIFTICAMAIVYLYMLKILFLWEMPSNEVFTIISALFGIWLPVWIMTQYYTDNTKYMKIISIQPYLFIPLILLQGYSMGIRIYEYGMTPGRYMGVMLIIFEIGTIIIRRIWKEQYEKLLPFLGVLIVIAVFVPGVNMNRVSDVWQLSLLKKYYQAVENGEMISEHEYWRLTGAYHYLKDRPEMQKAVETYDIFEESFAAKLDAQKIEEADLTDITEYETYHIHCCQMVGDIELDGYSEMSMLNQNDCYDNVGADGTNVDFSAFQFVRRETGEMITIDISEFAKKCMEYIEASPDATKEQDSAAMREYNRIEVDKDTVFYVNHFEVKYNDGIKGAEPYFEWRSVNISGMLLQK